MHEASNGLNVFVDAFEGVGTPEVAITRGFDGLLEAGNCLVEGSEGTEDGAGDTVTEETFKRLFVVFHM